MSIKEQTHCRHGSSGGITRGRKRVSDQTTFSNKNPDGDKFANTAETGTVIEATTIS